MKRDPLLWGALAAALVVTASAEYALARSAGFGAVVAGGVPAALDIYVIRALRARRDVAAVVLAMVAVNAASHLVAAGLLPVSVPLVVAVSAIAPLVLWRVHRLAEHIEQAEPAGAALETERNLHPVPAEPEPEPVVIERVPEPLETDSATTGFLTLGPFVPIAELTATPSATPVAPAVAPVALMSVADVAEAKGVAEGTVRSWVKRSKLDPADRDSNGRLLFHPDAVAALGATP